MWTKLYIFVIRKKKNETEGNRKKRSNQTEGQKKEKFNQTPGRRKKRSNQTEGSKKEISAQCDIGNFRISGKKKKKVVNLHQKKSEIFFVEEFSD